MPSLGGRRIQHEWCVRSGRVGMPIERAIRGDHSLIHDIPSSPATQSSDAFRHVALFYAGERAFVDAIGAFVRDSVSAGEPALVVVSARKIELLRAELGDAADRV